MLTAYSLLDLLGPTRNQESGANEVAGEFYENPYLPRDPYSKTQLLGGTQIHNWLDLGPTCIGRTQ